MPDLPTSSETAQTTTGHAVGDLVETVDVSDTTMAGTGTNKQSTLWQFAAGLQNRRAINDIAFTVGSTDTVIYGYYGYFALTTARVFTLCAANAVPGGFRITVADEAGNAMPNIGISVKAGSGDTINGVSSATNFPVIRMPFGTITLMSDGASDWVIVARTPVREVWEFTVSTTIRMPVSFGF